MSSTGFSVGQLFKDPNFQGLLAGVGTRLDPQGFGGAIGGATTQYIQGKAAQGAIEKQDTLRKGVNLLAQTQLMPEGQMKEHYVRQAIDFMGGFTNKGMPGVDGMEMTPTGGVVIKATPPGPVSETPIETPAPSQTQSTQQQQQQQQSPSVRLGPQSMLPFYLAPAGSKVGTYRG